MKVLLFEYVAGGGWWEVSADPPSGGLLAEGRAMLEAVAADFAAVSGVEITVLRDARCEIKLPAAAAVREVDSAAALHRVFQQAARDAAAALVIAPETNGALARFAAWAASCGARLLGPAVEFITVAADKERTAAALNHAGIAAPRGVIWPAGRFWPAPDAMPVGHTYPLVWKPLDGCGSADVRLVVGASDPGAPNAPGRLEEFVSGEPASCLVLGLGDQCIPLPPCRQILSGDGRFQLLGLELLADEVLIERAQRLATQAVAVLPTFRGLVGVDLVLGEERDVAIEINPRLTTSYVLVRQAIDENLAEMMLSVSSNDLPPEFSFSVSGKRSLARGES